METTTKTIKKAAPKKANNAVKPLVIKSITSEVKDAATELAKEVTAEVKKVDLSDNVEKIKETVMESAKVINNELKTSGKDIATEVKEISAEIKKAAVKSAKKIVKKVDVKGNVVKAEKIATKLNKEFVQNVEDFKKTSTKLANEMVENMHVTDRMNAMKSALKNANKVALETSTELIDGVESNVVKWQGVAEKAIKTGFKLADSQSNMVFTTLEAIKNQVGKTSNRFKKLFTA